MCPVATEAGGKSSIVFVIDDDPSIRRALEDLLGSVGLNAWLFGSVDEFLKSERPDMPACLVLDIRMPGPSGLDFQRSMEKLGIDLPIIFITAHGDIPMSVKAMKAGAIEFLTKPFRDQDLLDAIQVGLEMDRARRNDGAVIAELQARYSDLSDGERDVLALVLAGLLNKQVAARLGISEITVKVRRANIMRKMHAKSLPELVRTSQKLGIAVAEGSRSSSG
jgi:FixJ family two-component response regulator